MRASGNPDPVYQRREEERGVSKVTAYDIKVALGRRHERNNDFFMTECKNGPSWTVGKGELYIFDAVAMRKSWSKPCLTGYEIKVSRSDFLRDSKFYAYLPYFHELYIVAPNGLIERTELPTEIGLICYNPATRNLTTRKKAVYRDIEISTDMLLYIIMSKLDNDRIPFTSTRAEYYRRWLQNKLSNRELGHRVSNKMIEEIKRLEGELSNLRWKDYAKELNEIDTILRKHRIPTYDRAASIDNALSRGYPEEWDNIRFWLERSVNAIDDLKRKPGGEHDD